MNYLTNYYKNLSEQLQEKINYYTKLIESYSSYEGIMPDSPKKLKNPIFGDGPLHELPDEWKYPHPKPEKVPGNWDGPHDDSDIYDSEKYPPVTKPKKGPEETEPKPKDGGGKFPKPFPPYEKEKKPIKGSLFDRDHLHNPTKEE